VQLLQKLQKTLLYLSPTKPKASCLDRGKPLPIERYVIFRLPASLKLCIYGFQWNKISRLHKLDNYRYDNSSNIKWIKEASIAS
jgi:hypothetical protein